ncbi:MAG: MBL fold metallo-hydrolase [Kiritimatiellia bacterium]|jgi:glyoxylase-like metal-dependent hydrolase (beta-lactamase superfamily II)
MNIEHFTVGPFQSSCYIAWGAEQRALVIDPGADAAAILAFLDARGLGVAAYLLTHGHMDHIGALAEMAAKHPVPYGMHALDFKWAFGALNQSPPYYSVPRRPAGAVRTLEDGQTWTDGGLGYTVIGTPGHSPGSVCFYFPSDRVLFSGDTLFQGTVGRTDLPGGDGRVLAQSLHKLAQLPPETRILPGHGPATRLAEELRINPFLKRPQAGGGGL